MSEKDIAREEREKSIEGDKVRGGTLTKMRGELMAAKGRGKGERYLQRTMVVGEVR